MTQNDSSKPLVVIVDALSTGAMLARQAADDFRLIHIRSRAQLPDTFAASLPVGIFEEDLTYPGQVEQVLQRLVELGPVAVIPASEFGVEVADEIAARLGLRGNDPAHSLARRDKSLMMDALRAAGVRTPRQLRSGDVEELVRWWRESGLERVVVKPIDSAGSDDVFTCDTEQAVRSAATAVLGKTNLMLRANEAVLVQEYLDGDEYIVNSVSRDGVHWFTDAWISGKVTVADRKVYDYEDLLASDDPRLADILAYVSAVLDGLGIVNGPAHTELILTAAGPVLLETGARVSGLANPPALDRCTGADQVTLTLDCYVGGGTELAARPNLYARQELARCVSLIARREVPFPAEAIRERLTTLPAFESIRFRRAEGTTTARTVDLNSSPAAVFLVHRDAAEIERAYKELRELELELL
ncbi:ATP-grasp domain-containing protein [Streptacidiphilus jiangxiensis]|uniref:Biotin carboxylase n=1 Tax=Streptacidiphilus jiangxiensis TaxID=235985 RepID=A0A1H7VL43_STRJI|nr:ATP-grasp domain-containing protein [Streptacidiphilus jiangxiensis]SEM09734.1 Biotin carboxylase [Streptacidiphilus jiangxiensis]